jgi:hypothetical protein
MLNWLVQALLASSPPTAQLAITSASRRCSLVGQMSAICREFLVALADQLRLPSLIRRDSAIFKKGRFAGI